MNAKPTMSTKTNRFKYLNKIDYVHNNLRGRLVSDKFYRNYNGEVISD